MRRFPLTFTVEDLNEAWSDWRRNDDNVLRFGQYLYNKHINDGKAWPELFHERNPYTAYNLAFADIHGE